MARVILSNQRDVPLLLFLWNWKLATTAAIAHRFFRNCRSGIPAYNRLLQLKRSGFIEQRADVRAQKVVWTPSAKGHAAIADYLPPLREEGYKSENIHHDWIVSAVHLGDWLNGKPQGAELFTEQQLRRFDPEFYPSWVPKSDLHRPDGYWLLPNGNGSRVVALEVELARKRSSDYQNVAEFYSEAERIGSVLWVVPSLTTGKRIQRQIQKSQVARTDLHNFVILKSFLSSGWQAVIELGPDTGRTIESFLGTAKPCGPDAIAMPAPCDRMGLKLLDTRKKDFAFSPLRK